MQNASRGPSAIAGFLYQHTVVRWTTKSCLGCCYV